MTSLEAAARAAALEDGVSPPIYSGPVIIDIQSSEYKAKEKDIEQEIIKMNKRGELRRGKWTVEEEAYANRLIHEFKLGLLPLTDGTTLRTFLSKLLNCDPMRISKKFVGQNCIGKQVFRRRQADLEKLTPEQMQKSRNDLVELERCFLERVALTNKSKSAGEPKNGRYTDENCGILQPWMMPPEEVKPAINSYMSSSSKSTTSVAKASRPDVLQEAISSHKPQQQAMHESSIHNPNTSNGSSMLYKSLTSYSHIDEFGPITSTTMHMSNDVNSNGLRLNDSMNRVNSLDALCNMDVLKMPSPRSVETFQMLIGRDGSFPWSSNKSNDDSLRSNSDVPTLPPMFLQDPAKESTRGISVATSTSELASSPVKKTGNEQAIIKNSSVENFWMLVNYGDLPRPDTDVLSETLWQRPSSATDNTATHTSSNALPSVGKVDSNDTDKSLSSLLSQKNFSPAQILHMQQHRLYDYYTKQQEPILAPAQDTSTTSKRKHEELDTPVETAEQQQI